MIEKKTVIPLDFTRSDIETIFLEAIHKTGMNHLYKEMIVVYEPHKRFQPDGLEEERISACHWFGANMVWKGICRSREKDGFQRLDMCF